VVCRLEKRALVYVLTERGFTHHTLHTAQKYKCEVT
jgi:hypothetical protein